MIQAFIMRHVIAIVISSTVKLIDKYGEKFDGEKAKIYIKEQIQRTVPPSMWGEKFIEDGVIAVSDFVIDRFAKALFGSTTIVGDVFKKLANKDWAGAIALLRTFIVSIMESREASEDFASKPDDVQSVEFAEVVQKSFSIEAKAKGKPEIDFSGVRTETTEHKLA